MWSGLVFSSAIAASSGSHLVIEPDWATILIVISDLLRYNSSYKARRHGDHTCIDRLEIRPVKELHW